MPSSQSSSSSSDPEPPDSVLPWPNGLRPSFFELFLQERMLHTVKPVMRYSLEVVGRHFPQWSMLLNWLDELHLLLMGMVQHHYLARYDASFSESFYSLKRVSSSAVYQPSLHLSALVPPPAASSSSSSTQAIAISVPHPVAAVNSESPSSPTPSSRTTPPADSSSRSRFTRLGKVELSLSLFFLAGLPYLKSKFDSLYQRLQLEAATSSSETPPAPSPTTVQSTSLLTPSTESSESPSFHIRRILLFCQRNGSRIRRFLLPWSPLAIALIRLRLMRGFLKTHPEQRPNQLLLVGIVGVFCGLLAAVESDGTFSEPPPSPATPSSVQSLIKSSLKSSFLALYPYFHLMHDGLVYLYHFSYLFNKTNFYDPWLRASGLIVKRLSREDRLVQLAIDLYHTHSERAWLSQIPFMPFRIALRAGVFIRYGPTTNVGDSFLFPFLFLTRKHFLPFFCRDRIRLIVPVGLFGFRFMEWYYSVENSVQNSRNVIPPPPDPPVPASSHSSFTPTPPSSADEPRPITSATRQYRSSQGQPLTLPENPELCPICRGPRRNPAFLPTGLLFCYTCIFEYVREHQRCPYTHLPVRISDICRLYGGG